jgi:hypothetical protein
MGSIFLGISVKLIGPWRVLIVKPIAGFANGFQQISLTAFAFFRLHDKLDFTA